MQKEQIKWRYIIKYNWNITLKTRFKWIHDAFSTKLSLKNWSIQILLERQKGPFLNFSTNDL